jgi:hypothetical protein
LTTKAEILNSVAVGNCEKFIELGGNSVADINFHVEPEGIFPLLIAASNGE